LFELSEKVRTKGIVAPSTSANFTNHRLLTRLHHPEALGISSPTLRTNPLKDRGEFKPLPLSAEVTIMADVSVIISHLRNQRLIIDVSVPS
jgi:hypothetical protein